MAAAATIGVLPACNRGQQQLLLVHTTKLLLPMFPPLLTRRSVAVRAAPPRQEQRSRARKSPPPPPPPPRRQHPRGRARPPTPLDHEEYDDDADGQSRFAGGTRHQHPRGRARPPAPLDRDEYDDEDDYDDEQSRFAGGTRAASMPKPPAGFVLDDQGRCIAAASKRIVTIIDETNNRPLECIIRRVFRSSQDHECMLLCPVDMPVQVLKSTNFSGWVAVDDDQLKKIIPSVAYALARVHMHFVESGFCYTARGGFCFPEEAIQEFHDSGDGSDGVPFEGVEICCFNLDGAHYMIYTPVDPLLFVAVKDKDGVLRIAEDELMDDPAIVSAIDEETEFTALVEEEEALLETVLGER